MITHAVLVHCRYQTTGSKRRRRTSKNAQSLKALLYRTSTARRERSRKHLTHSVAHTKISPRALPSPHYFHLYNSRNDCQKVIVIHTRLQRMLRKCDFYRWMKCFSWTRLFSPHTPWVCRGFPAPWHQGASHTTNKRCKEKPWNYYHVLTIRKCWVKATISSSNCQSEHRPATESDSRVNVPKISWSKFSCLWESYSKLSEIKTSCHT